MSLVVTNDMGMQAVMSDVALASTTSCPAGALCGSVMQPGFTGQALRRGFTVKMPSTETTGALGFRI